MLQKQGEGEKLREVSSEELTEVIQAVFEQGGELTLRVTGMSMYPTLCHMRDSVRMVSAERKRPAKGDIIFFRRKGSGQYILHRIVGVRSPGVFLVRGDAQREIELVTGDQVVGVVVLLSHKGRWIQCGGMRCRALTAAWRWGHLFRRRLAAMNPFRKERKPHEKE